jgi:peptide/nickel transport system substrate-binding protein
LRKIVLSKNFRRAAAVLATAGLGVLAACSSNAAPQSSGTGGKPISTPDATVTFGESPGSYPNYIFPFENGGFYSPANVLVQYILYRPLYWFSSSADSLVTPSESVAEPPDYTNNDTRIVINLKHWKWSDGEPVDAQDVVFWMNLMKTEPENWGGYVPGDIPDNVTNVVATGQYQVTVDLDGTYSPQWFTYDELSQVTPIPQAWDVTSATASPGSGGCSAASYSSIKINPKTYAPVSASAKACAAVFDFLSVQSGYNPQQPNSTAVKPVTSYASNPLWQVTDGAFKLSSFQLDGRVTLAANPKYSGSDKPHYKTFVFVPFTSEAAEYNALAAGALTVGNLPPSDLASPASTPGGTGPNNPELAANYNLDSVPIWGIGYVAVNRNSTGDGGAAGPIFRQLYIRQALQSLVDQPAIVEKDYKNYAVPVYGPVPTKPGTWTSPTESVNPYPYSVARATALLKDHGWTVVPNGTSVCARPGTGSADCGAGIPKGTPLKLSMQFSSGVPEQAQEVDAEKAAWSQVGINVSLSEASFTEVYGAAVLCTTGCAWEMQYWAGWSFEPDFYPTGDEIFATGAESNPGDYSNAVNDQNIRMTETTTSKTAMYAYQDYLAKQLPVIWEPNASELVEVKKGFDIGSLSPNEVDGISPWDWYFTKS